VVTLQARPRRVRPLSPWGRVAVRSALPIERDDVTTGEATTEQSVDAVLPDLDGDPVPTWDEIASRYGRTVYTMAYRLTGDPEEAKDLSQDVFVRVYRNLDKYEPGTFEGWLYRITKNLFLDRVRRKRRIRMEPLPDEEWRQPTDEGPGPADQLETGVLRGDIEVALTELPPAFRTAVVMCDVQGLAYEEIAEATGWPLGTVRSRIHRGRKLLRQVLTERPSDA
jgi:RNA polymerase sigma-70 factor, ECF subfamily